jgi:tripartite ATP-independent transporter DctP family solute receptor
MDRRSILKLGGGVAALGLASSRFSGLAEAAGTKMTLKASDVHPPGYPTVVAVEDMGKKLAAETKGRLSITMYPSMQLGGEKEAIEQAQTGAIAFARVSVGTLGPVVDDLNVFNLPFVFRNTEHMEKVIDGPIGKELLQKVSDAPNANLVGLCFMDAGARSMYDTKRSIKTLADMKGLKMRVMGNPIYVAMMNALGADGVPMGYDQVFSALQTGVIDGAENNPPSYVFDHHYEVVKHFTFTEHLIVPEMLVMSRPVWNKLSKPDQELVVKLARAAQFDERKLWKEKEADALARMKAAHIDIQYIADKTPWQEAEKPVWAQYGAKYATLIKAIQEVK